MSSPVSPDPGSSRAGGSQAAQWPGDDPCAREPIHRPGAIQAHGALLVLAGSDLVVSQASANAGDVIGCAGVWTGARLASLAPALEQRFGPLLRELPEGGGARLLGTASVSAPGGQRQFHVLAHRCGGNVLLELEIASGEDPVGLESPFPALQGFVDGMRAAGEIDDLCRLAAAEIRHLTGFDRVLVYRFAADWTGTVVAEDGNGRLSSYLDLRFPASDIPAQARDLYRRNRLRLIPDSDAAPVAVVPEADPETGSPLDLSDAVLRAVSPVHLQYMRNMGTRASLSISILDEGRLWGLVSCHNATPRQVSPQVRNACDFLTQLLALQIAARGRADSAERRVRLGAIQAQLLARMAQEERFIEGLVRQPEDLLRLADAHGAAVVSSDHCWLAGRTPSRPQVRALLDWLAQTHPEDVFATDELSRHWPEAATYTATASGLLAIPVSKIHASYVLWFRQEVVQTVNWAGDPQKQQDGADPLRPRHSFAVWQDTVRHRSAPWEPAVIEAVRGLRHAVVGIVLRRAEELASVSEELRRSNKELEAFSYSISHDLRAPFRHIVGYAELMKRQEGETFSDRGRRYLETIIESAVTAGRLVDDLLAFSQMGRTALRMRDIDMNRLVAEVKDRFALETRDRAIVWRMEPLPPARADPVMLRLVVENLLSNAIKYSRGRNPAEIEVTGRREGDEIVYAVRDNGVGFDMAYVGKLFGVFQRLHRVEDFEGTGIGLANVRRIVERHGGRAWAQGVPDGGATFSFTLAPATEAT